MKRMLLLAVASVTGIFVNAQLLTWSPAFPKENDPSQTLVITMNATRGNQSLLNYSTASDVYVHIGVITTASASATDWKHVPFTWGTTSAAANASSAGANKWQYSITGSLRTFFNITDPNETILKIAILFRNGNGSKKQANADNSDMYVPVYSSNSLAIQIYRPAKQPTYFPVAEPQNWTVGTVFQFGAIVNKSATVKFYNNGNLL
ncbi:MAG TPA: hypothetical protein VL095_06435, partial [Flavisolibacter sp.]|nr:hypothetical protein [Flavisolibacter sp.]